MTNEERQMAAQAFGREPMGAVPMKAMVKKLMTRPRLSSSARVCMSVLQAAFWVMRAQPVMGMIARDR